MKTEYIKFLCSEYDNAGIAPVSVVINHKKYLIPYVYIQNYKEPLKYFLTDFFDVMRKDFILYKRYNVQVRYVLWHDGVKQRRLIVPFAFRNLNIDEGYMVEKIIKKAEKKYKKTIIIAHELKKIYPNMVFERMVSAVSLSIMLKTQKTLQLKQNRSMAVYITNKVGSFLSKNPQTFNFQCILSIMSLKQKAKKWALKTVLRATIESSVYNAINHPIDN